MNGKRATVNRYCRLSLLALAACRAESRPAGQGTADSMSTKGLARPPATVAGSEGVFDLMLPTRWSGHFRVDSLSTRERGRALPGALVFEYVPADSSLRPEALMALAVYDSLVWQEVRREAGPPPGDSVAGHGGRVYVIGLPRSNPFVPGSIDASVFELLKLRTEEIAGLIRFR